MASNTDVVKKLYYNMSGRADCSAWTTEVVGKKFGADSSGPKKPCLRRS